MRIVSEGDIDFHKELSYYNSWIAYFREQLAKYKFIYETINFKIKAKWNEEFSRYHKSSGTKVTFEAIFRHKNKENYELRHKAERLVDAFETQLQVAIEQKETVSRRLTAYEIETRRGKD